MHLLVNPVAALAGSIDVAGDKSISHRAVLLAAIADGETRISRLLEAADVLATLRACRQMGVSMEQLGAGEWLIRGGGLHGLRRPAEALDLGNSGTALRLLTGLLSAQQWPSRLVGDASLSRRPMGRITRPLGRMGALIEAHEDKPPLQISPAPALHGLHYTLPVASAQVKSCLLLAGLYARGETCITEPVAVRDHTERMLAGFGYPVQQQDGRTCLHGGGVLHGCELTVPADLSSAAFFVVGGLLSRDSEIRLPAVGVNPSRNGILPILSRMGARIEQQNPRFFGREPVADLLVRSSRLHGCEIGGPQVALAIDDIPAIAIAAAAADGVTRIRQAAELRVKESDRIHSVVQGLSALGVKVEEQADGMTIYGGRISGGQVHSFLDHRIAMAFSMASLAASGPIRILDCDNIATSFPDFADLAVQAGMALSVV